MNNERFNGFICFSFFLTDSREQTLKHYVTNRMRKEIFFISKVLMSALCLVLFKKKGKKSFF